MCYIMFQVRDQIKVAYTQVASETTSPTKPPPSALSKIRKSEHSRIHEAVKAVALCHNVTPVWETKKDGKQDERGMESQAEADQHYYAERQGQEVVYQASSPDEVSLITIKFMSFFSITFPITV